MPSLFDEWCETKSVSVANRHKLHLFRERDGIRSSLEEQIDAAVASHYEDPLRLSERIARVGLSKAAEVLRALLPQTKKARSGHLGEILATEAAPAVLKKFQIPIKRLRWLDGREAALRGEETANLWHAFIQSLESTTTKRWTVQHFDLTATWETEPPRPGTHVRVLHDPKRKKVSFIQSNWTDLELSLLRSRNSRRESSLRQSPRQQIGLLRNTLDRSMLREDNTARSSSFDQLASTHVSILFRGVATLSDGAVQLRRKRFRFSVN